MSVYLKSFSFPSELRENEFLHPKNLTPQEVINCVTRDRRAQFHKGSLYPFNVISATGLKDLSFEDVTILYGENGCGKTTSLNVIAQKLGLSRESLFNTGRFFGDYIDMCCFRIKMNYDEEYRHAYNNQAHMDLPVGSKMITSDDIFRSIMSKREFNSKRNIANDMIAEECMQEVNAISNNMEKLIAIKQAKEKIQAKYLEESLQQSNGESAIKYLINSMEQEALYILDEPENSLSIENLLNLKEFIETSARFFNCQFIIATHSPVLLSIRNAKIYDMDSYPVKVRKWTDLANVRKYFDFFMEHKEDFK